MPEPVFVDCETTGLDPDRHDIWEIGLIDYETGAETNLMLAVDDRTVREADPIALSIGHFHERHPRGNAYPHESSFGGAGTVTRLYAAQLVAELTHGRQLAGAVPSFDEERLRRLLLAFGIRPSWHYHLLDVEAMAVGYIHGRWTTSDEAEAEAVRHPWDSDKLSLAVGVDARRFDRHTALGDCRWARAIYNACTRRAEPGDIRPDDWGTSPEAAAQTREAMQTIDKINSPHV